MGKPAADDILDLDQKEVPELIKAIESSSLSPRHKAILQTLINQMMETDRLNREKMAKLRRIKQMLAKQTEKKSQPKRKDPEAEPKKGHGRNGVEDYQFATVVPHAHHLKVGQVCPDCGHGTLQGLECRRRPETDPPDGFRLTRLELLV